MAYTIDGWANEMEIFDDEQMDGLDGLALFPAARKHIPLLWRANHHVCLQKERENFVRRIRLVSYWLIGEIKMLVC